MQELDSSELGTLDYWENSYRREIKNFQSRGDPGEIWFGEDSVDRIVNWMNKSTTLVKKNSKILDLGCGNGMLLVELANQGYKDLKGVDYSENAINLAKAVAKKHGLDINYSVENILESSSGSYDVILDKGTYDAISLSEEAKENRLKYIKNVHCSLKENGIFIITSCNWTLEELNEQFTNNFSIIEAIPTPQFKFGGKIGSVVTSCVYKKK